jgi:hypothetical protein
MNKGKQRAFSFLLHALLFLPYFFLVCQISTSAFSNVSALPSQSALAR